MKSLIRWSATLSLLGSTLIGTWFAQMPKVLALPEADVVKVLQGVPVFTITTEQGGPLIATLEDEKVTQVFMSQEDANKFLAQLKENQPEIGIGSYSPRVPDKVKCFTEYLRAAGYYCTNNAKEDYNFATPISAWNERGNTAGWEGRSAGQPFFSVFNFGITHECYSV